jgi:hypothetical protein
MLELVLIVVLLVILVRVTAVSTAAEVSPAEFMQCLAHTEEPAVVVVHRSLTWLFGAARNRYILVFRGHRIHMRSFKPIAMPEDVVVIETRAL